MKPKMVKDVLSRNTIYEDGKKWYTSKGPPYNPDKHGELRWFVTKPANKNMTPFGVVVDGDSLYTYRVAGGEIVPFMPSKSMGFWQLLEAKEVVRLRAAAQAAFRDIAAQKQDILDADVALVCRKEILNAVEREANDFATYVAEHDL